MTSTFSHSPPVGAQPSQESFGARLARAMDEHGPLCAGIDPHAALLGDWGLPDSAGGLESFAMRCVEAFAGHVACVKPQSAFFERHGSAGVAVLERVVAGLREAGTLCLLDVKRGDIGSTMAGYAQAYLGRGPLGADAMTVSPYLGYESLRPALDLAAQNRRGVFVLALTSNPEGRSVQHAVPADAVSPPESGSVPSDRHLDRGVARSVAGDVVAGVGRDNEAAAAAGTLGDVGMVIGATIASDIARLGLDLAASNAPLLAPGIGAQGGSGAELAEAVGGAARRNILAASSREILRAGPGVAALTKAARMSAERLERELRG